MTLGNRRACALAFLAAFAALFLQVLVHRIISAKLLNNYAFLVISLTMLGFAAAGAVLSFVQRQVLARLPSVLTVVAALYAATTLVACVAFYRTETSATLALTRPGFVRSFFDWMPFALLFALPFGCIAFILGTLLAARDLDTRRIYFFDLLGSALGAMLVIPAIRHLGVETDMLLVAAFLPVATLALLRPPSRAARATVWIALAAVALVAVDRQSLLDLKPAAGSPVSSRKPGGGRGQRRVRALGSPGPGRSLADRTSRSGRHLVQLPGGERPGFPRTLRASAHAEPLRICLLRPLRRQPGDPGGHRANAVRGGLRGSLRAAAEGCGDRRGGRLRHPHRPAFRGQPRSRGWR